MRSKNRANRMGMVLVLLIAMTLGSRFGDVKGYRVDATLDPGTIEFPINKINRQG